MRSPGETLALVVGNACGQYLDASTDVSGVLSDMAALSHVGLGLTLPGIAEGLEQGPGPPNVAAQPDVGS